jgi:GTP1/Obg family GTP-binding protein
VLPRAAVYPPKYLSFDYVHRFYREARRIVIDRRGVRPYVSRVDDWAAASKWDREVGAVFMRLLKDNGIPVLTKEAINAALAIDDE